MNKLILVSICTLLMFVSPVFAVDSGNGMNMGELGTTQIFMALSTRGLTQSNRMFMDSLILKIYRPGLETT